MATKYIPLVLKIEQDASNKATIGSVESDLKALESGKGFRPIKLQIDTAGLKGALQQTQQGLSAVEAAAQRSQNRLSEINARGAAQLATEQTRSANRQTAQATALQNQLTTIAARGAQAQATEQARAANRSTQQAAQAANQQALEQTRAANRQAAQAQSIQNQLTAIAARGAQAQGVEQARAASRATQQATQAANQQAAQAQRAADRLQQIQRQSSTRILGIEAQRNAQLSVIQARRVSAEQRHQQRLREIAERERARIAGLKVGDRISEVGQSLTLGTGIGSALIAQQAVSAAITQDTALTRLRAVEGSIEKAQNRLVRLRALSQESVGLTATAVTQSFTFIKSIGDISDRTGESLLKGIGRLNAAFAIDDINLFIRNLVQIFNQGFERADIKEAIGRVPIFEQLLQNAFGTKDADKLRRLKDTGELTLDAFLSGFASGVQKDTRLAGITESIATRLEKLKDRASVALIPLGQSILGALEPIVANAVPIIERIGKAFDSLPTPVKTSVVGIGAFTAVLGPALIGIGSMANGVQALITLFGKLNAGAGLASFASSVLAINPALLALGVILAGLTITYLAYESAADKAAKITVAQVESQAAALRESKELQATAGGLTDAVSRSAVEHEKLESVIRRLDPATQAYVRSLGDEKQQLDLLNTTIVNNIEQSRSVLEAQFRTLVAGAAEFTSKIKGQGDEIAGIQERIREYQQAINQPGSDPSFFRPFIAESSQAIVEANSKLREYTDAQKQVFVSLFASSEALGLNRDQFIALTKTVVTNDTELNTLIAAYDRFKSQQASVASATANSTSELDKQAAAYRRLADAVDKTDLKTINDEVKQRIEAIAKTRDAKGNLITPKEAVRLFNAQRQTKTADGRAPLDEAIKLKKGLEDNVKAQEELLAGPKRSGGGRRLSPIQQLTRDVAVLKVEIASLERGGGQFFDLQISKGNLEETKSQLTEILKLRRFLDLPQTSLPKTRDGREQELRLLQREKDTREQIRDLADAQAVAEAKLRVERARTAAPVVSALTRSDLAITEELNKQREAEAETAGRILTAERQIRDLRRDAARLSTQAVESLRAEELEKSVNAQRRLTEVTAIYDKLASGTLQTLLDQTDAFNAQADKLNEEIDLIREIGKLNAAIQAGRPDQALVTGAARARDTLQRLRAEQQAIAEITIAEERLVELRKGSASEVLAAQRSALQSRLQAELQVAQELAVLREQEKAGYLQSAEFAKAAGERAELERKRALQSTAEQIIALQDQIANAAEGSADRMELAYLQAIRNIQTEDEAAAARLIQNQVKISQQGVINYRRLNDGVVELLAQQKGLTEIFADFRTNQVKTAFDGLDSAIDKITSKLGKAGDATRQLIKDLVRLAATKLFEKIFAQTGTAAAPARQSGGGISGIGQTILGALGLGGGGGIAPVSARTPTTVPSGGGGAGPTTTDLLYRGPVKQILQAFPGRGQQAAPPNLRDFLTGGIGGGNPAQQILGGGGGQQAGSGGGLQSILGIFSGKDGQGGIGGLLKKIPGVGRLFGSRAATQTGSLASRAANASAQAGNAVAKSAGTLASLGAGGLLLGGGIAGSLAGRGSAIGGLLGNVGGTLLAGFAGASGLFGGTIAGLLPAFFSNPFTAIIGGALLGGALLAGFLKDRDLKGYKNFIKTEYGIDVKNKEVLKQVREVGKQLYGKNYKKFQLETVKSSQAREILASYADATGQRGNGKLFRERELGDEFNPINRFTAKSLTGKFTQGEPLKRELGGSIFPGRATLVGERRPELAVFGQPGEIFPSIAQFEKELLSTLQARAARGGLLGGQLRQLASQIEIRSALSSVRSNTPNLRLSPINPPESRRLAPVPVRNADPVQGEGGGDSLMLGVMAELTTAIQNLRSVPAGHVVEQGLRERPGLATRDVATSLNRKTSDGLEVRDLVNRTR